VRERLLRNQVLSAPDLKQHIEQLPDLDGEYEVLDDTPQPAVVPVRSVSEEPLVFDGIRRLQALTDSHSSARYAQSAISPPSSNVSPLREVARPLGTPLRSALMESEISGVGAGAVSAALGAMAAEARSAAGFPPAVPTPPIYPETDPAQSPLTLRSQAHPEPLREAAPSTPPAPSPSVAPSAPAASSTPAVADWEAPYPDSEDLS
jgi:hypothetical protein